MTAISLLITPVQQKLIMKFFVLAALFATIAFAAPADDTKAVSTNINNESSALKYLLANSPAGHQAENAVDPAPSGCFWSGTAPFCAGACPSDYEGGHTSSCGDGACCWSGYKLLCCKDEQSNLLFRGKLEYKPKEGKVE
ncbi:hypothetical protein CVT25_012017 [Psilocybe cyanescens]|uniref:Uncharacterized protein n=1 Tax=Psilocybe cyanescens TaxID=93625 RepID=A0A409XUY8_PSICY|nr:hypothetical protein CVT25_012017 [Psilocybe cyanescens]